MARLRVITFVAAALICVALPISAHGASRLTIRGAGFGHGVGMSQYGAYGFAQQGSGYKDILRHYYTGTDVTPGTAREVRVLLQSTRIARFTGASSAAGRRLNPKRTYRVRAGRITGTVDLISWTGRRMKRVVAPLRVTGPAPLVLRGRALNGRVDSAYRGALEFRPGVGSVFAINAVGLEDYVRGVVGDEMPPSWHPEALKAQAVAARTYAVTTSKAGNGWDQYPDTRSQVYGGVGAEEPTVDVAVAATKGELVTYQGTPVVTFFFSTSGGRTEDVENTPLGVEPKPWLKSVEDPFDDLSPRHRWGPIQLTLTQAGKKLKGLVKGRFRGIEVLQRGKSPRVVAADVIGTDGTVRVNGATLRARLGLYDTWAYFTSISTDEQPPPEETPPPQTGDPTGGTAPGATTARAGVRRLAGRVIPARAGSDVVIEVRRGKHFKRVGTAQTDGRGRYAFTAWPGKWRVRFRGVAGPAVRLR
jgi:stage II sporulation protein D